MRRWLDARRRRRALPGESESMRQVRLLVARQVDPLVGPAIYPPDPVDQGPSDPARSAPIVGVRIIHD